MQGNGGEADISKSACRNEDANDYDRAVSKSDGDKHTHTFDPPKEDDAKRRKVIQTSGLEGGDGRLVCRQDSESIARMTRIGRVAGSEICCTFSHKPSGSA